MIALFFRTSLAVTRRELAAYFQSPLAYVFIVIFLALAGTLTFKLGNFLGRNQADLSPFFGFHPWLYLFLVPAVAMRLWAEERRAGTLEFLTTLPMPVGSAVLGKFLAAWIFTGVALALTFPLWITVNILGQPDNGVIAVSYGASWLLAGGYLALGACVSALTRNQVIAFVLAAALAFVFMASGLSLVQDFLSGWVPPVISEAIARFSLMTNFQSLTGGVIDLRSLVYFASLIVIALCINGLIVQMKKGG